MFTAGLATGACGQTGRPPKQGGVTGHFWVCAGPSPGHWQGVRQYVVLIDLRHHLVLGRTITHDGAYSLAVKPGQYSIIFSDTLLQNPFRRLSGVVARPVTVKADATTLINFGFLRVAPIPAGCRRRPGPARSFGPGIYLG
jgi:hypothetical protein